MPDASIVIPSFARPSETRRAVDSALNQSTLRSVEIIVVVDFASRWLEEYQRALDGLPVRIVSVADRVGGAAARNIGATHALAKTLFFLDSDDIWLPFHLEAHLGIHESQVEEGLVYSAAVIRDKNDISRGVKYTRVEDGGLLQMLLQRGNVIGGFSGLSIGRKLFWEIGGLDGYLLSRQDFEFMLRCGVRGVSVCGIEEPDWINVRHSGPSITQNHYARLAGRLRVRSAHRAILRKQSHRMKHCEIAEILRLSMKLRKLSIARAWRIATSYWIDSGCPRVAVPGLALMSVLKALRTYL